MFGNQCSDIIAGDGLRNASARQQCNAFGSERPNAPMSFYVPLRKTTLLATKARNPVRADPLGRALLRAQYFVNSFEMRVGGEQLSNSGYLLCGKLFRASSQSPDVEPRTFGASFLDDFLDR